VIGTWGILGGLGGLYGAVALGMYAAQRQILFPRTTRPPDPALAKSAGMETVTIPGHDGLPMQHWYRPAQPGVPTVAVFHGNAGTVGDRVAKLQPLLDAGFGVLLAEYRGYGGNPGRPTEGHLLGDAEAVLAWLAECGIPAMRTALYGESLGTGVAVAMAARRSVGAVVLDAPFTSIAEVAQRHYWYVPAKWLVRDRFDSLRRISEVTAPVLVLHGRRDRIVPLRFGRRLFAAANEPKQVWIASEGGHMDLWDHGADRVVVEFLAGWLPIAAHAVQGCAPPFCSAVPR
jgi:hypothetical protein